MILDVSTYSYSRQLCAAALQGLINRAAPLLFLDYGIYDDPNARRTNEVFMDDEHWYGKYRDLLGNQDQRNLAYYQEAHGLVFRPVGSLEELILQHGDRLNGCVVWDASMPDTANLALMHAAQENLLVVETGDRTWAEELGFPIQHDLTRMWEDRTALYGWAFEHLFPACKPGFSACVEPAWQRPEFVDYLVQERIFTYSLSCKATGWGGMLLLLLAFGPAWLRELIFTLRLDPVLRRLGLAMMERRSSEVRLASRIQRKVKAEKNPTIFGWHTRRDDELAFMLHLSANDLRLVPSHMASNFSFHSRVAPLGMPEPARVQTTELDPKGVYLTFTLSDGDQLMMMSTGQLGNWYSPERGSLPFNWETQPLLVDLAPALFEKYARTASPNDCLIAGPSGAGYIIPPLAPDLDAYLEESRRVCQRAGIDVITFYVADPPKRVYRQLHKHSKGITGYLGGYAVFKRTPIKVLGEATYAANRWPTVPHIWDEPDVLLEGVRKLIEAPGPKPRFIGIHLFAYRTTLADVVRFAAGLHNDHVHIVRADTFLQAARLNLTRKNGG
jgi:hypothetical protein